MNNTINEMTIVPITGQVISETTMGLDVPYIDAEEVFDNETLLSQILRLLRLKN